MEALEPFNYDDAVEFSGAYLSGYLADKYDVSDKESIERAKPLTEKVVSISTKTDLSILKARYYLILKMLTTIRHFLFILKPQMSFFRWQKTETHITKRI